MGVPESPELVELMLSRLPSYKPCELETGVEMSNVLFYMVSSEQFLYVILNYTDVIHPTLNWNESAYLLPLKIT